MTRNLMIVFVSILILSSYTVISVSSAPTATITVTSKLDTADPGKCRLRDAITAANINTAIGDCPAGTAGLDTIGIQFRSPVQPGPLHDYADQRFADRD